MKNIYSDPYSRTAGLAATPMSDSVNARVLAAGKWWGRIMCNIIDAVDAGHCDQFLNR